MVQPEGGKRFALLLATADSEFVKKTYGGYYNVFMSAFREEGEIWDLFRVIDGEFPEEDDLEKYDAFVISGSTSDAFVDDDWVLKLCDLCKTLDSMKKKVLGICFGHQILCRMKGGKVGRALRGPDLGVMKLTINKDLASKYKYFGGKIPSSLFIISCHQDEVLETPEGADVTASSDKYNVEMCAIGDHIFGIQGHPEYTKDILFEIIDRALAHKYVTEQFAETAKSAMENAAEDRKSWERLCNNFLKGRQEFIV